MSLGCHYCQMAKAPSASLKGNRAKLVRYFAVLDYLRRESVAQTGRRVLHAYSRDVIFQRDPFTIPADPARPLDVFLEDYFPAISPTPALKSIDTCTYSVAKGD